MAAVKPEQLGAQLKRGLKPVYVVTGDEPLLVQEACDQIRRVAREQGYSQHEIHHAEAGFNWDNLLMSANALSLFAEKKILDVRIRNGKPGDAGGKALKQYCTAPPEDTLLLLVLPKLDKRQRNTAWFKAVDAAADVISLWPIHAEQLPRWIEQRMNAAGLRADDEAIGILCAKIEGNLLAAVQEIEKLKLLSEDTYIDASTMASVVMDSARYNVFDLVDKALLGDARAAVTCLSGLRAEGNAAPVILWALVNQVRQLAQLREATDRGRPFDGAYNALRLRRDKQRLQQMAHQRLNGARLHWLLRQCALADRQIKGLDSGDEWNTLLDVTLGLAGIEALNRRSLKLALNG